MHRMPVPLDNRGPQPEVSVQERHRGDGGSDGEELLSEDGDFFESTECADMQSDWYRYHSLNGEVADCSTLLGLVHNLRSYAGRLEQLAEEGWELAPEDPLVEGGDEFALVNNGEEREQWRQRRQRRRAALAEAREAEERRLAVRAEMELGAEARIEEAARYAEMQAAHVAQAFRFRPPGWAPSSAVTAMEGVEGTTQLTAEPQAAVPAGASRAVASLRQQVRAEHVLQNMQGPPAPGQAALPQAAGGKSPRVATPLLVSPAYDLY